ncbi:hypothetical protein C922_04326 [Plasmodium inui San Antonio 1]|uniref:Programmed cell death protein 2 C-terminal domain-containing protein n=1 Tax=Plasmodium inui San Antonio 1 TaxID=1237626 RepID=W6ZWM4_9APIC|nr:hypothetical protein C922_04326 [Plasmodium inui San Antonio 1]EUD65197.1 hypothetical protein C922_04326 [Plasmodium inui San Antonio 1]
MGHVLLGYTKERGRKNELHDRESVRKKFVSKIGGRPFWLDRINLLSQKEFHCFLCSKLMSFLLQVYAPIDKFQHCFHRCLYVFICLSCGNQVKCFRTQLPRNNPFYEYNLIGGGGSEGSSRPGGGDDKSDREEASNDEYDYNHDDDHGERGDETGELSPEEDAAASEVTTTDGSNGVTPTEGSDRRNSQRDATRINKDTDYLTLLIQKDKNKFDEQMEYLFCCRICGIPCANKRGKHKECLQRRHVIFREKKIYIDDEDDCVSRSTGSWSSSGEDELVGHEEDEQPDDQSDGQPDCQSDCQLDGSEMNAFEEIQKEVLAKRNIDRVFLSYCSKLRRFPNQLIRYSYNGDVLLSSSQTTNCNQNNVYDQSLRETYCSGRSPKSPKKLSFSPDGSCPNGIIPPQCHVCKRRKVFEFQVLSTIINYLEVKKNLMTTEEDPLSNLKFTYISVYTCERNCDTFDINSVQERQRLAENSRYIQEYASVQAEQ